MDDNLQDIFSGSECPPHSQLVDYFLRKLTDEEMHRVEQHLVDCEMCSDELEGLSKMKDPRDLEGIIEEINARTYPGRGKILGLHRNYALMAAAAVIVLVVGTVMIIRIVTNSLPETSMTVRTAPPSGREEPALQTQASPPPPAEAGAQLAEPSPEGKPVPAEPASATQEMEQEEQPVAGVVSDNAAGANAEVVEEAMEITFLEYKSEVIDSVQGTPVAPAPAVTLPDAANAEPAALKRQATESKGIRSTMKKGSTTLMDIGMEEFRAENYTQAALFFARVTDSDPKNREAAYYLALCWYHLGETSKAVLLLHSIEADTASLYSRPASELLKKIEEKENR